MINYQPRSSLLMVWCTHQHLMQCYIESLSAQLSKSFDETGLRCWLSCAERSGRYEGSAKGEVRRRNPQEEDMNAIQCDRRNLSGKLTLFAACFFFGPFTARSCQEAHPRNEGGWDYQWSALLPRMSSQVPLERVGLTSALDGTQFLPQDPQKIPNRRPLWMLLAFLHWSGG